MSRNGCPSDYLLYEVLVPQTSTSRANCPLTVESVIMIREPIITRIEVHCIILSRNGCPSDYLLYEVLVLQTSTSRANCTLTVESVIMIREPIITRDRSPLYNNVQEWLYNNLHCVVSIKTEQIYGYFAFVLFNVLRIKCWTKPRLTLLFTLISITKTRIGPGLVQDYCQSAFQNMGHRL